MSVIENKEGELYFLVKADLALVVEHRSKIERLFSVTLLLDVQLLANQSHWIGVKGDSRDRLNAKIYILSLVNCPDSVCNEEKKIYLPPEVGVDVIETVERRTTAVIISENLVERLYLVRGSKLSVTAALTAIEEVIERDSLKHHGEFTPKRLNKASRRLSCALQETLTKKNQRGNYVNTSDAVKRAIASCLIEESEKPSDDDDVILIEDNSDEDIEPIVIDDDDDDDDDVIFIDTPKPRQDQTDQSDGVFFNDKENEPANSKSVEQLTKAFSDMKTPSKSMLKSTKLSEKTKVPIKPLNFNQLNDDDNIEVFLTFEETAVKEKEVKKKKKKHKRKRAKKRTASKIEDDTVGSIIVNGNAIVREGKKFLPEENENLPKRQRIKSAVVKPDSNVDNLCETEVKGVQNGAQVRCRGKVSLSPVVFNRFPTQRVQPMFQHEEKGNKKDTNEEKTMSDITEKRKGKKNFSDIVRDNLVNKATATDNSKRSYQPQVTKNFKQMSRTKNTDLVDGKVMINSSQGKHQGVHVNDSSKDKVSVSPRTTSARSRNDLRYIVIDGSNVAMAHGIDKFSCKGIKICVDYFRRRGHANITVFLPHWRKCRPLDPNSVTYRYVLDDLEKDGYLVYTPSRRIGRKLVASYDDRFVIELAEREDGIVVSNDQYRDLLHEKHSWRRVIETRLLMFTFVRDHFMLPDDPYGRDGPSLDELLRQSTTKSAIPRDRDMFSTLKCLEMNNPSCDPREAERDFYGYRGIRY